MAQIGTVGGIHIPNYLLDSTTGKVVAPIQAGNIYGPVAFPQWVANVLKPFANKQTLANSYTTNMAGYGTKKG